MRYVIVPPAPIPHVLLALMMIDGDKLFQLKSPLPDLKGQQKGSKAKSSARRSWSEMSNITNHIQVQSSPIGQQQQSTEPILPNLRIEELDFKREPTDDTMSIDCHMSNSQEIKESYTSQQTKNLDFIFSDGRNADNIGHYWHGNSDSSRLSYCTDRLTEEVDQAAFNFSVPSQFWQRPGISRDCIQEGHYGMQSMYPDSSMEPPSRTSHTPAYVDHGQDNWPRKQTRLGLQQSIADPPLSLPEPTTNQHFLRPTSQETGSGVFLGNHISYSYHTNPNCNPIKPPPTDLYYNPNMTNT